MIKRLKHQRQRSWNDVLPGDLLTSDHCVRFRLVLSVDLKKITLLCEDGRISKLEESYSGIHEWYYRVRI